MAEKKRVCFLRGSQLQDLLHIVDKAHVQHPVGLVQNEDLQFFHMDIPLIVEILQPAGGGHQNVHARFQLVHLGLLSHPAEDDGGAEGEIFAVGLKALLDLEGQLPGGGEDEGADGAALHRALAEPLKDGGGEGTGLAGAGLGAAQHVPPGQGGGDGLGLDGGGGAVVQVGESGKDRGAEAQGFKGHSRVPFFKYPAHSKRKAYASARPGGRAEADYSGAGAGPPPSAGGKHKHGREAVKLSSDGSIPFFEANYNCGRKINRRPRLGKPRPAVFQREKRV